MLHVQCTAGLSVFAALRAVEVNKTSNAEKNKQLVDSEMHYSSHELSVHLSLPPTLPPSHIHMYYDHLRICYEAINHVLPLVLYISLFSSKYVYSDFVR